MICQQGLNLFVVCKLTDLIHGAVVKLSSCVGILGKPSIKPCKGLRLSISSNAPYVVQEVIGYDEVSRFTIPSRKFIIASFCFRTLYNKAPIHGDPLAENSIVLVIVTRATVSVTDFAYPAARATVYVCGERNIWYAVPMFMKL
jgi:hypothetical protein